MAKRKLGMIVLILLLAMLLASGCTAEGEPISLEGLASGEDQATPADMERSPGDDEGVETSTSGDEDVVTSTGETISGEESGERVPGRVPGRDVPGGDADLEEEKNVIWQVYRNDEFGFEVRYPSVYVIVPAPESTETQTPKPLAEILFQDWELAQSESAFQEPPQFAIRVFDNSTGLPVEEWLRANEALGEEGIEVEPYSLGGVEGVQVTSQFLMAPGRFIYLAKGDYVYELVPLGQYAKRMLAGFTFTQ